MTVFMVGLRRLTTGSSQPNRMDAKYAPKITSKTAIRWLLLMLCRRLHASAILTVALAAATSLSAQTGNKSPNKISFEIAPVPSWVKPIEPPGNIETGSDGPGIVYLLADRQDNLDRSAFYYREVRKIVSEKGIQSGASISIRFN